MKRSGLSARIRVLTSKIGAGTLLLVAAWSVLGTSPAFAQASASDLQKQQIAALDRGDVAGVMALFAPDVSYEAGSCIPKACVGTVAVRDEISREVADHLQVMVISTTGSGDSVSGSVSITSDGIRAVTGVKRILATFVSTSRGGVVVSVVTKPDLTDSQTVSFIKAEVAKQNPAALAFTGANPIPLAVGAVSLVLVGLVLRRSGRRRR